MAPPSALAGDTLTQALEPLDALGATPHTHLVLGMEAQRPLAGATRWSLDGIDTVFVSRGEARRCWRSGTRLELTVPNPTMSAPHARLRRRGSTWLVTDAGSKNGTLINGLAAERDGIALTHGDLLELGATMFLVLDDEPLPASPLAPALAADHAAARALATADPQLRRQLASLVRIAPTTIPVLILGESGTGKELTARAVHAASGRTGDFVTLPCGGRSSCAGSDDDGRPLARHATLLARARGGTLFLDDVAALSAASQRELLRSMHTAEHRYGRAANDETLDVRVVAATHQDIHACVETGRFRRDLYARLAGYTIELPALRHRRGDIGDLVATLLRRVAGREAERVQFRRAAARALLTCAYPVNIRELEHRLRSALLAAGDEPIGAQHLRWHEPVP